VATVEVDLAPGGVAASPDGRYLYVTSRVQRPLMSMALTDSLYGALAAVGLPRRAGTLTMIDLKLAEVNPVGAVIARVPAGCAPARVAAAPDGKTVWVTAQQSNELLGFATDQLRAGRTGVPAARVRVGAAPTALRLVKDGRYALVADIRRSGDATAPETVNMIDTAAALAGRPALRSTVSVGGRPQEIGLTTDQHVAYVANSGTSTLTSLDLNSLLG
jgi:DNA-binding beta-propeller fold protein YncE